NLVFSTDSYLSDSSEVTNYTVDSTPAKSEQSEISSATEIFKNLEFADDSTLSAPSGIVSPNESPAISETSKAVRIARIAELLKQRRQKKKKTQKDEEMMRMVELLKRYGTDSNRLQSLTEIGGTSLEDDICKLRCTKERIGIFYFVIWLCLVLVILFWKSSASSGVSSSVYRIPPLT
ncbi:hypothetical protein MKW94_028997, partial [Papaver nudicaule]|nr:hypothetical protein [Papaver nudicaule]